MTPDNDRDKAVHYDDPSRDGSIGETLLRLQEVIALRRDDLALHASIGANSYVAKMLTAGPIRCAKKLGEEAVEAALAGACGSVSELTSEAADLVFHLLLLLASRGVTLDALAAELRAREGVSGIEEKRLRSAD